MVNSTEGMGDWEKQKSRLKQRFAILTDDDLFFQKDKKDEMLRRLQLKLGKSIEELISIITAK